MTWAETLAPAMPIVYIYIYISYFPNFPSLLQFEMKRLGSPYYRCHPSDTAGKLNHYNRFFPNSYSRSVSNSIVYVDISSNFVISRSAIVLRHRMLVIINIKYKFRLRFSGHIYHVRENRINRSNRRLLLASDYHVE